MSEVKENEIVFAKIKPDAKIPSKRDEDAGYDMWACFDGDFFVVEPGQTKGVPTGIAVAFNKKYYAQVEERSSMAKAGIKKSGGVMDSGYRGEYVIMTYNTLNIPFVISKLDFEEIPNKFIVAGKKYKKDKIKFHPYSKAICQIVLQEIPVLKTRELSYEDLMKITSERMTGGFGSSDKRQEKRKK